MLFNAIKILFVIFLYFFLWEYHQSTNYKKFLEINSSTTTLFTGAAKAYKNNEIVGLLQVIDLIQSLKNDNQDLFNDKLILSADVIQINNVNSLGRTLYTKDTPIILLFEFESQKEATKNIDNLKNNKQTNKYPNAYLHKNFIIFSTQVLNIL